MVEEWRISQQETELRQKVLDVLKGLPAIYKKKILVLCLDQVEREE